MRTACHPAPSGCCCTRSMRSEFSPPVGHPGWVGWLFSTAASFMTQLCSALFIQPWPLLIYLGKQEPCTQPLKKELRPPVLGLTSHTVPCVHSIQFRYFSRKGGIVDTWQEEGPLIHSPTHSFMHSLLVECLLGAWPHVKDTVKVLSSPLESDKFWGDCQGRSDHPGEA